MPEANPFSPPFEMAPDLKLTQPWATHEFPGPFLSWLGPKGSTSNQLGALPKQPSFKVDVVLEVVRVGEDSDMTLEGPPVVILNGHIVVSNGLGCGESILHSTCNTCC